MTITLIIVMGKNSVRYVFDFVSSRMLGKTMEGCAKSHFSDKSLQVEIIDNGIVLPCAWGSKGGIVCNLLILVVTSASYD